MVVALTIDDVSGRIELMDLKGPNSYSIPLNNVGVTVNASGLHIGTEAEFHPAHQRIGVNYDNGSWSPISDRTESASGSVTVAADATLDSYVGPEPSVSIYHLCDVSADVQAPYLELNGDTNANPWWTLNGGLRLDGVTARCAFSSPYEVSLNIDAHKTLASADGPFVASGPTSGGLGIPDRRAKGPGGIPTIRQAFANRGVNSRCNCSPTSRTPSMCPASLVDGRAALSPQRCS